MKKLLLIGVISLSFGSFSQIPNYVPTNGLVGWWPFNGNANDESGNGNNGSVNGATLTTDRFGNANNAYYFSGAGCATRIDASINTSSILNGFTLGFWLLRTNNGCGSPRIMEFYSGTNGNGDLQFAFHGNSFTPGLDYYTSTTHVNNGTIQYNSVSNNQWVHILFTCDGVFAKCYQDGILISTFPSSGNALLAGNAAFGRMNHPAFDAFNGVLDDIGIWNRALTACEIQDLYNAQLNSSSGINAGTDQTVCEGNNVTLTGSGGSNYQWNNGVFDGTQFTPTATQDYILTGVDGNGCLGADTVNVQVLLSSISSETITQCDAYTWNTNGQTYTQSGQYTEVLANQNGCDSIVTLNLTITNSNSGSETITECDSYTWNTNGQTYTQSGQYVEVLSNQNGCDSTVTLNLTINSSSSSSQTETGLDSYTWPINNLTYMQSGTYSAVIPNAAGCDSTITLNLTLDFTGIGENGANFLAVYPNPTTSFLTIEGDWIQNKNYLLVDIQGRAVVNGTFKSNKETIDLKTLARGQYLLRVAGQEMKVVKE